MILVRYRKVVTIIITTYLGMQFPLLLNSLLFMQGKVVTSFQNRARRKFVLSRALKYLFLFIDKFLVVCCVKYSISKTQTHKTHTHSYTDTHTLTLDKILIVTIQVLHPGTGCDWFQVVLLK